MSLVGHIEHLRLRRYLDAAIDGELPPKLTRRVRAHMAACPACTSDEATTRLVKHRLRLLPRLRPAMPPHDRPER